MALIPCKINLCLSTRGSCQRKNNFTGFEFFEVVFEIGSSRLVSVSQGIGLPDEHDEL